LLRSALPLPAHRFPSLLLWFNLHVLLLLLFLWLWLCLWLCLWWFNVLLLCLWLSMCLPKGFFKCSGGHCSLAWWGGRLASCY